MSRRTMYNRSQRTTCSNQTYCNTEISTSVELLYKHWVCHNVV